MGVLEDCSEPTADKTPPIENVGEEFIKWAEKYWRFEKSFTLEETNESESCPYSYIRSTFVRKINELVEEKQNNK